MLVVMCSVNDLFYLFNTPSTKKRSAVDEYNYYEDVAAKRRLVTVQYVYVVSSFDDMDVASQRHNLNFKYMYVTHRR